GRPAGPPFRQSGARPPPGARHDGRAGARGSRASPPRPADRSARALARRRPPPPVRNAGRSRRGNARTLCHEEGLSRMHPRPAADSITTMTEYVLPTHANVMDNVFNGQILAWVDLCAAICAQRYTGRTAITATI